MKKLKEEEGYTLVIALLMIVLFLSFSAVFIQASMSHAKQEQTVDQGNLAVTAAEMGVEKYSKEAENIFAKVYAEINAKALVKKAELETEVKKYPNHQSINTGCPVVPGQAMQIWIKCNIDKYDEDLRNEFFTKMSTELNILKTNASQINISDTLTHKLKDLTIMPMSSTDNSIKLTIDVVGEKSDVAQNASTTPTAQRTKILSSDLSFPEVPFFNENAMSEVEVKWGQPITEVTNFFPQLTSIPLSACPAASAITKTMPPCIFSGVITEDYLKKLREVGVDSSFYIKVEQFPSQMNNFNAYNIPILADGGTITTNTNINQSDNLTLYYKGLLAFQNTNKHTNNNFIVAEIITFQNNQNIVNNTIINVGNSAKSTYTASKITINDGSKLCVNLDGITPSPSDLFTTIDTSNANGQSSSDISVKGSGKIYLFSKTVIPTVNPSIAKVVYFNDATKFLESCGVSINYNVEGKEKFSLPLLISELDWDLEMDVDYQP
ncbi:hypothetical protein HU147_08025 [Planomicrobium chinense]|uniref:hypothetical protein n=1 Tax=Planococcus chinensis TaxID=272917 RepID=UPI001CC5DEC9|nr:hypothetical protein [Planococcus chinensis]MBZ5201158.1 hypothetical protein [Planococcus chinensis]